MPSAPELRNIQTLVGEAEILPQPNPHQGSHTNADIGISREIKVNLHGETQHAHEVLEARIGEGRI